MNLPWTAGTDLSTTRSARSSDASAAPSSREPVKTALSILTDVLKRGGPRPDEYASVHRAFEQLHESGVGPRAFEPLFASTLSPDCIHGWTALQPLG